MTYLSLKVARCFPNHQYPTSSDFNFNLKISLKHLCFFKSENFLNLNLFLLKLFGIIKKTQTLYKFFFFKKKFNVMTLFFLDLNSSQFSALRYSKIFSIEIYAGLTSILLGGLYLIWCDANISTNSIETLVLVFVYVYFIKNFVYDYCHSIQAIENGKGSLEKLKVINTCILIKYKINKKKL